MDEWKDTDHRVGDLKIQRKGRARRLVDEDGSIVLYYKFKDDGG